jgi:hypothetical protein
MINKTAKGQNDGRGKPIKTFPEAYEVKVWKMVMDNLDNETRTDGEEVFVVKDLNQLILDIMEFHENRKNKS